MIPRAGLEALVARALDEDSGRGDLTSDSVVPADRLGEGRFVARRPFVLAGMPVAHEVFRQVDPSIELIPRRPDGYASRGNDEVLAELRGPLRAILTGERVALNFLQRLSGVATTTRRYVDALGGRSTRLVDTRKTTPGLRDLEKYAVRVGGGHNHRRDLGDGVMIKDNHIVAAGGIEAAVAAARQRVHHLVKIQVEVEALNEARRALACGADALLLDNFDVPRLAAAVAALRAEFPGAVLEASGGITLDTLAAVADTDVDVISSGALIHQATWVDISLDLVPA